jgi:peroxiredoxin Q/BCP
MATATAAAPSAELSVGDAAPDIQLPVNNGGSFDLGSYKGKKNVVLYFYPKDDTPGCTTESKDFATHNADFEAANTVIIGLSKDSVKSHEKFRDKYCLPFPLASDEEGNACESYGCWVEKSMYGKKYMGIERSTFLIDKQGVIRALWRKVKVEGHVQEVLAEAKKLG